MDDKPLYAARAEDSCPQCGSSPCACGPFARLKGVLPPALATPPKGPPKQNDPVILRLDKSGRKGKAVTLVSGIQMHPQGKLDLLQKFKKICGAGGTLKEGTLELQGDHRDRLQVQLEALGYKVKRAG